MGNVCVHNNRWTKGTVEGGVTTKLRVTTLNRRHFTQHRRSALAGLFFVWLSWGSILTVEAQPLASPFGVWDRGDSFDPREYPFLKGMASNLKWRDIETSPGRFDWKPLDEAVQKALSENLSLYLSIDVGPDAPAWIYQNGVPAVTTHKAPKEDKWDRYPYYLSPAYRSLFSRLIQEFGRHIHAYPRELQNRIAFIQVKTGCTGDEVAYKGVADRPEFELVKSSPGWVQFRIETFAEFTRVFQQTLPYPKVPLLYNALVAEDEDSPSQGGLEWNWVVANNPDGFGIKNGALSRGHHLAGEKAWTEEFLPMLVDPQGLSLFRRSEMDRTWKKPFFQLNLPLNFYWAAVNALNGGQGVWDISQDAIEAAAREGFDVAFEFFNTYAGQLRPETATDAFCALHKGLDASDTVAYPVALYGSATPKNVDRMLRIVADYAPYGAAVDDKKALSLHQVAQREQQTGFNDVGWQIWPDNYSRFLTQLAPDQTSVPLWRIGGPLTQTSSMYSRFGRGFEHATDKDALLFQLHDRFFTGGGPHLVTMSVVWYDKTAGSTWALEYDAGVSGFKTAISVVGTGDAQWHQVTVTVSDAVLAQGGPRGADLALRNTDALDDAFGLVEVHRADPQ